MREDPPTHHSRSRSRSRSPSPIRRPYSRAKDSARRSLQTRESTGGATSVHSTHHRGPIAAPSSWWPTPPSMPEAGSTVTRIPISHILSHANSERRSSKRSSPGPAPRRSVKSMKRLMPLILSPSANFTPPPTLYPTPFAAADTASPPGNLGGLDEPENPGKPEEASMAIKKPIMGCTFPELLVRDLEASGAVFASKSMTAGRPLLGLETPDDEGDLDLDGLEIRRSSTPAHIARPPPRVRSLSPLVPGGRHAPRGRFHHDELRYPADISDSASDLSLGMEPSAVRTREQSFTTAATSVSGRCSSMVSQKPASPTSTTSAEMTGSQTRKGSWFDADADVDTDSDSRPEVPRQGRSAPGPSRATHKPRSRSTFDITVFTATETMPGSSSGPRARAELDVLARNLHYRLPIVDRPHTSNGPTQIGRPRIVDIQPPPAVPKRNSSLTTTRRRKLSESSVIERPKMLSIGLSTGHLHSENTELEDIDSDDRASPRSQLSSPLPVLETSCGRTVIDASKPPSFDLTHHDLPPRRGPTPIFPLPADAGRFRFRPEIKERKLRKPRFREDIDQVTTPHQAERYQEPSHQVLRAAEPETRFPTPVTHTRNPSFSTLASHAGSQTIETFHLTRTPSATSSLFTPGIPLPPEVVETLRVSIACFPETMLLSSSLSVETIRAYSKKLRHRVGPSSPLRLSGDADNRSVFSFSSCNTPKRPNILRSPSGRWGFSFSLRRRPSEESYRTEFGTTPETSIIALPSPTNSSHSAVGSPLPVTANWEPIRNIFPAATDYLCDALYAHIVAYNYVRILCPLPSGGLSGDGSEEQQQQQRIPKKAAHLLGLQDAPAGPTGLRRMASRRAVGGSGGGGCAPIGTGNELRDVQKGLRLCIGKLVAELKQERGTDGGEGGPLHSKEAPVDPLLLRSLCEVVRCSEEAL